MTRETQSAAGSVTVEPVISGADVDMFHRLYEDAFAPLRTRAAARQVLHRSEFEDQMSDPRVWKFVAWDEWGRPAGLTTLTRDLSTVGWISPEYFAARYPKHAKRNAIYYWGFTLTRGDNRQKGQLAAMVSAVTEVVKADRGVCGYDICAFNNDVMALASRIEVIGHDLVTVAFEEIDRQTYYCATLS
jgi:hypothetical protein